MKVILCHKCSGLLTPGPKPLYPCECISGYIRGFEKSLDEGQAKAEQIRAAEASLRLYRGQGRDEAGQHIVFMKARLAELTK
jgi:hypothetical protein